MRKLLFLVVSTAVALTACTQISKPAPTATASPAPTTAPTATAVPTPVRPTAPPELTVTVTADVPYLAPTQPRVRPRTLDVYAPAAPGPWPVAVLAHGYATRKSDLALFSRALAARGFVVFTMDWNAWATPSSAAAGNGAPLREWTESFACAIRLARETAADYGGNGTRITLVGHSMGGGVGLLAALGGDELATAWTDWAAEHGGPPQQVECVAEGGSPYPDAFVSYGGAFGIPALLRQRNATLAGLIDPATYIGGNPGLAIRFIHGERDSTISEEGEREARRLLDSLAAGGYSASWIDVDSGHGLSPSGPAGATILDTVLEVATAPAGGAK